MMQACCCGWQSWGLALTLTLTLTQTLIHTPNHRAGVSLYNEWLAKLGPDPLREDADPEVG